MAKQYQYISNNNYWIIPGTKSGLRSRVGVVDYFVVYEKETALNVWENVGGYGDPGDEIVAGGRCRMGVRGGNWVVDIELSATGFLGTEDTDWKNIGEITSWNNWWTDQQSAIFDTRDGLTITDSVGGESISIGNFPMTYMPSTGGTDYPSFRFNMLAEAEPESWTLIGLFKTFPFTTEERRAQIAYPFKRNLTCTAYFRTSVAAVVSAPLASGISYPIIDWSTWQAIGYAHDATDNTLKFIWNKVAKSAADNDAASANPLTITSTQGTEYEKWYFRGFYAFNKVLSESEINDIRLNGIFPSDCDVTVCPWLDVEDSKLMPNGYPSGFQDHWDGIKRYKGQVASELAHGFIQSVGIRPPTDPYSTRDSLLSGAYLLYKGYSRQGINVIPYNTSGVKVATADTDDIEYPATDVIHNMAESFIDFSGVTDADIKAIFDKTNRTYWKASIESTDYYSAGQYLWHPSQLLRDFIELHAETNHAGHIFASVRTSGTTVTGITKLTVCKSNIS